MRYFLVCLSVAAVLSAAPENPVVVSGDVSFTNSAQALEVTASDRAIVDWQRFSIDVGETVRFLQPSTAAVVLNRVTGTDVSALSGTLQSNGTVYLINPRGVIVGAAAWGNGTLGLVGTLSDTNSLIGTTDADSVSSFGIVPLANDNYVVGSPDWQDPNTLMAISAATYGNGGTGTTGTVSIENSVTDTTGGGGLNLILDNLALPGTFVVRFTNTPAVFIGIAPPPPPSPSPSSSTPAHDDASARTQFSRAIAESFYDWNTRLFGPYLSNDPWAPLYTAKGLLINLPSLVLNDPWEAHTLLQEIVQ